MTELYGLKQIAPFLGVSVRHAKRLLKKYNIPLERNGPRGHIRMTPQKAIEIRQRIFSCPTLSPL